MGKLINFKWGNHFMFSSNTHMTEPSSKMHDKFLWDFLEPSKRLTVHGQPIMLKSHRESDLHLTQPHICLLGGQQDIH